MGKLWDGQLGLGEEVLCDGSWKTNISAGRRAGCRGRRAQPWSTLTQDESAQVRLETLELVRVILQLFLGDPPGVTVGAVLFGPLVQLL